MPEDLGNRTQRHRKTLGVPRIVLGPRQDKQLARAVRLLRVDRKDQKAPVQQPVHHRPVGNLERYPDRTGIRPGVRDQPGQEARDPPPPVGEGGRATERAGRIGQVNVMLPITEIDAGRTRRRDDSSSCSFKRRALLRLRWPAATLPSPIPGTRRR